MKKKTNQPNICGVRESNAKRDIHSITRVSQKKKEERKKEKAQINNITLYLKELEKESQRKPKLSRRKKQ